MYTLHDQLRPACQSSPPGAFHTYTAGAPLNSCAIALQVLLKLRLEEAHGAISEIKSDRV